MANSCNTNTATLPVYILNINTHYGVRKDAVVN